MKKQKQEQKKLGISLRGGGARSIGYLGFFKALREEGIKIHSFIGSSGGALIASSQALGLTYEEVIKHYSSYKPFKGVNPLNISKGFLISNSNAIVHAKKMAKNKRIEDTKIPLHIQTTDIKESNKKIFSKGPLAKILIASSAMGGIYQPVEFNKRLYCDGDMTCGFDSDFLKQNGADVVIGLTCEGEKADYKKMNFLGKFLYPIFISINRFRDLDAQINKVDLIIKNYGYNLGVFDFKEHKSRLAFDEGYKMTKQRMGDIKKLLYT